MGVSCCPGDSDLMLLCTARCGEGGAGGEGREEGEGGEGRGAGGEAGAIRGLLGGVASRHEMTERFLSLTTLSGACAEQQK